MLYRMVRFLRRFQQVCMVYLLGAVLSSCVFVQASSVITPTPGLLPSNTPTQTVEPGQKVDYTDTPTPVQPTPTLEITIPAAVQTPSVVATVEIPASYYITEISGHKQYFPLGCETAAALDWARYLGYDFNEFEFQYALPLSDNPDLGFVGDVNSPWGQVPPYGYGVYAGPIADLLNSYNIPASAKKDYTLEELRSQIAMDHPVMVWVIGNMVGGIPSEYTDQSGNTVIVAAYEHAVVITGYSETDIRYMNNGKFYEVPTDVFLNSWGVLGNMVVVVP